MTGYCQSYDTIKSQSTYFLSPGNDKNMIHQDFSVYNRQRQQMSLTWVAAVAATVAEVPACSSSSSRRSSSSSSSSSSRRSSRSSNSSSRSVACDCLFHHHPLHTWPGGNDCGTGQWLVHWFGLAFLCESASGSDMFESRNRMVVSCWTCW